MIIINERLKQVRLALGMTQEEFGISLGQGRGFVTNIERKLTEVKPATIDLVCKTHGVRREYLLTGEEPMFRATQYADALGELTANASKNTLEDADAYFARIRAELGDAKFLMLYEIFRSVLPQYDKPIDGDQ